MEALQCVFLLVKQQFASCSFAVLCGSAEPSCKKQQLTGTRSRASWKDLHGQSQANDHGSLALQWWVHD